MAADAPVMGATVIGATKKHLMLRIPLLHPHRILTLDRKQFPRDWVKGMEVEVEVHSDIEPSYEGWHAWVLVAT